MPYKFIKTKDAGNDFDQVDITYEFKMEGASLDDLLNTFQLFLAGCGFSFKIYDEIQVVDTSPENNGKEDE